MKSKKSTFNGNFGPYGGQYVSATLLPVLKQVEQAYADAQADPIFQSDLNELLENHIGRPTALTFASRLTERAGGAKIYLKREDLAHTGAHKINHAVGQALLAKRMGKQRVIAETGAGQHGVACAAACALVGIECVVYMGKKDIQRQSQNVFRMQVLGAKVLSVSKGNGGLKEALDAAMDDWGRTNGDSYHMLGSALGPYPYPVMIRDFQRVIGLEAKSQILAAEGRLPDLLLACVGGGANALGLFHPFLSDHSVEMVLVEAGGQGLSTGRHAVRLAGDEQGSNSTHPKSTIGVLHGMKSMVLQNPDGTVAATHSISSGLNYPSIGPELAWLKDQGRIGTTHTTDDEAMQAVEMLSRGEGIIPALESAHAVFSAIEKAKSMPKDSIIIVNLSGRGDKDLDTIMADRSAKPARHK